MIQRDMPFIFTSDLEDKYSEWQLKMVHCKFFNFLIDVSKMFIQEYFENILICVDCMNHIESWSLRPSKIVDLTFFSGCNLAR